MEPVLLDLPYKADRDYLHGTDMYDAIVHHVGATLPERCDGQLGLLFRKLCRHQGSLSFFVDNGLASPPENLVAEFRLATGRQKIIGWVSETTQSVTRRIPYPEEQIVGECIIQDHMIEISRPTSFSAIEVLVAMNKHLHEVFCSSQKGKWLFTRLELQRLLRPKDASSFKIVLSQNFRNLMTKSTILIKDRILGYIYFSLVIL